MIVLPIMKTDNWGKQEEKTFIWLYVGAILFFITGFASLMTFCFGETIFALFLLGFVFLGILFFIKGCKEFKKI